MIMKVSLYYAVDAKQEVLLYIRFVFLFALLKFSGYSGYILYPYRNALDVSLLERIVG